MQFAWTPVRAPFKCLWWHKSIRSHAFAVNHWIAMGLSMRFRALITFWKITWNTLYALANQDSNSEPSSVNAECVRQEQRCLHWMPIWTGTPPPWDTMAHTAILCPVHDAFVYICWQFRLSLHRTVSAAPADWRNPGHMTGWWAHPETHRGTPCLLSGEPGQKAVFHNRQL